MAPRTSLPITQTQTTGGEYRNQSFTVTATCTTGTRIGGGGEVTDNDPQADHYAVMISSKPTGTAAWSVTGYSVVPFVENAVMIVQSWVLCAS